jgi:two-component system OmpR family response regulator
MRLAATRHVRHGCAVIAEYDMHILLADDDAETAPYLAEALTGRGHKVDLVGNGRDGLDRAQRGSYDAVIIDRLLPGLDGLSIIRALREARNQMPVLVLSALGEVDDRVKVLLAGGDDYLVKPVAIIELLARLAALTRRGNAETRLMVADVEMNLLTRTVTRAGREVDLLPRELRLLEYLMRNAGQVVTRTMMLEKIWDSHVDPETNVIDVHVGKLRQKIDKGFSRPLLHTVRGAGYTLRAE